MKVFGATRAVDGVDMLWVLAWPAPARVFAPMSICLDNAER